MSKNKHVVRSLGDETEKNYWWQKKLTIANGLRSDRLKFTKKIIDGKQNYATGSTATHNNLPIWGQQVL